MKQNKIFQLWRSNMVKKTGSNSKSEDKPLLKIIITPTTDESALCPMRIKEIQDLVAEIIILGMKRGRPSHKQEELKNVA
jgi:hypothetical protein